MKVASKSKKAPITYRCRDCKHSYECHEIGADGKPFLCRCPFHKWSKFLNRDYCKEFKHK